MSNQTKVGKRPGMGVYVQASAIDGGRSNLKDWEISAYQRAKKFLARAENFAYNFVHILQFNEHEIRVRFLLMSSVFDAHPHVAESRVVNVLGSNPNADSYDDGKVTGQIYHRLETIVDPEHPSWIFHREVTKWEESIGLFSASAPQSSFGSAKAWKSWVETKMPYADYERKLCLLFGQFVGNELLHQSKEDSVDLRITRVSGSEASTEGEEIHIELMDGATHKSGIRAAFTFDQFARALTGEQGIKGKIVRWTLK